MLQRSLHSLSVFVDFVALAIIVFSIPFIMVPSSQQCILLPMCPQSSSMKQSTKGAELYCCNGHHQFIKLITTSIEMVLICM